MPTTWSQWGVAGSGPSPAVETFHIAVPHVEAPEHWCDSDEPTHHKMRSRYFVEDSGSAGFVALAYLDSAWDNFLDTVGTGTATAWTSTWAAAEEMDEYPDGDPIPYPFMSDPPRYKVGHININFGNYNVICYGIEVGAIGDNGPAAADDVVERTPRTGASIRYDEYMALCSYLVSTILAGGMNKFVESARWRVSGPFMGDR